MVNCKFKGSIFKNYFIDNKGCIYNKDKKKLKPWDDGKGYLIVDLMKDNNPVRAKIHEISAETFIGKRSGKNIINHKDGNKHNNAKDNLEYISQRANVAHAQELIKGKEYLSEKKVTKIKDMLKLLGISEVAKEMKLPYYIVRDISNGKTYTKGVK